MCSLLETSWLRQDQSKADDAGIAYGAYARFWVEPERREEFERASETRRAAWVWRRYVTAVRSAGVPLLELRYERLAQSPGVVAEDLAAFLGAPVAELAEALGRVHAESVGRWRQDLDVSQLADVTAEAGPLLAELGYADDV